MDEGASGAEQPPTAAVPGPGPADQCATLGCPHPSRWPRVRRSLGWCDACLTDLVAAAGATVIKLGDGPRDRFRTRHDACGAVVDVSLPMIRRGGWVCQMCRNLDSGARWRTQGVVADDWPVARQEQLLTAAGMRALLPLADADGMDPINVECLQCGGVQVDSFDGISEGLRLSWLPCSFCNAARFKPTTAIIAGRFASLGMQLLDEFDGDPGRALHALCRRCDAPRSVSWTAISSGSPPCLRCDGARLDPAAPHRVYLVQFAHLGDVGVFKVGITHCVDDARLHTHQRAGATVIDLIEVRDRATALALERQILDRYRTAAPVALRPDLLPGGGTTECWAAHAGHPDLTRELSQLTR